MDAAKSLLVLIVAGVMGIATNVAAQSWTGNTTAPPATNYNRYSDAAASTGASISAGAQNTFNNSSAAVQNGLNDGIRAAQQSVTNTVNSNIPSSPWTTPSTTTRTAAPTPTAIPGGWTSIGSSVAPPPLLVPQSPMATPGFSSAGVTGTRSVASYPAVASNDSPPLHSVLTDPAKSSAPTTTNPSNDFASGWDNMGTNSAPATIGRSNSTLPATAGSSSLPPLNTTTLESNPWDQPSQPTLGAANGAISANRPLSSPPATNNNSFSNNTQPNNAFSVNPNNNTQPLAGPNMGNLGMAGTNPNSTINPAGNNGMGVIGTGTGPIGTGRSQTGLNGTAEPQPWMPLIASVLTLAGSLAANLYLGVSYLDARQKYQSLVRKTADTFRRVKAVAA